MNRQLASLLSGLLASMFAVSGMAASNNASINLSGQVVDEAGNPLQDVQLFERSNRFNLLAESFLSSTESSTELDNGEFEVSCRRCSSINLYFSKPGFYSESLDFRPESRVDSSSRLAPTITDDLQLSDIRVVLRSAANSVRLTRYRSSLQTSAAGIVTVMPIRRDLGSRGVSLERLQQASVKREEDPGGYIVLVAQLDEDGELAEQPQEERPGARIAFPAATVLDFGALDGGIQLYRQTSEYSGDVYHQMRTAPENGYQKTLDLSSEPNGGEYYFYCRIGQLYCKGYVGPPSFDHSDDGEEVVTTSIQIRLNPDGSRNLETAN